jgi:hypothetical protein
MDRTLAKRPIERRPAELLNRKTVAQNKNAASPEGSGVLFDRDT